MALRRRPLRVALSLEYSIQFGAICELVPFHGWPVPDVEVDVGESDAVAQPWRRKARIAGAAVGFLRSVRFERHPRASDRTTSHLR